MFTDYGLQFVRFDEAVFQRIQPSILHYRKRLLYAACFVLAGFFLLYPLLRVGFWGFIVFLGILTAAAVQLLAVLYMRAHTVCIVTNSRVIDIDRQGMFTKEVVEMPLGDIRDIRYTTKGVIASVFHLGHVIIQGAPGRGRIELHNIPKPADLQSTLLQIQRQHTKTQTQGQDEEE